MRDLGGGFGLSFLVRSSTVGLVEEKIENALTHRTFVQMIDL